MIGYVLTVTHTSKPARVAATATATVKVEGTAAAFEVVRAGLAALHESPTRLFGYGIMEHRGYDDLDMITDEIVTVYARRD